ncbi:hypothetical protein HPB49_001281 [Dermacentor silvarum]|uniref:Uncharacterized protein n=1 Tax=Dermacentor silvarum TaxID=543639 RepID=A0ACB8CJ34_DERSI|nr:leucine-rich repeat and immunoglobulin-like domain containing-NOGO receptor-interacting protein 4 isoform X1 [Dermacentor silvarum]XP_049525470.1 leucine-rich repeat and immunoglobulin-like domain containing-NOGO receptor-interacting protein 4 isoform X1 [Dermacentor silvarum]KAH7944860.1 hypothetical protein HPB49_001281 [Dermacentor silvarum]
MFGVRLLVELVIALLLNLTGAHPICYSREGPSHCYYFCEAFTSTQDFLRIDRYRAQNCTYFVLKDSSLERLPSNAFVGTSISVLHFMNVTVGAYGDRQGIAPSPFDALKDSLCKLIFSDQPKALESWNLLRGLKRLETLLLLHVKKVNLTADFNHLPPSVKEIQVLGAHVDQVDQDWLAELHGLNAVAVKETNLESVSRSMLPRPAPKLMILDFADNRLTSLPKDLTTDMPALRELDVGYNEITTLHESTLAPLKRNRGLVRMIGNPLTCDCRLAFLLTYPKKWNYYPCAKPLSLATRSIQSLTEAELCNETSDRDVSNAV